MKEDAIVTKQEEAVSGTINLLILLDLLVDLLVGLLAPLALFSIRLGGITAKAAHDRCPGKGVRGQMQVRVRAV